MKKKAKPVKYVIEDESNHNGTVQESLSEKEKFVWMEITIILRKNGGHIPSSLDSRSFPEQAGRLVNEFLV